METKQSHLKDAADRATFTDEISIRSKWIKVQAIDIDGTRIVVTGNFLKTAFPKEEWCDEVKNPEFLVSRLKKSRLNADIFTFWQKLPEQSTKYNFQHEYYSLATLPISSYDHWWNRQIDSKTRNMVRKSEKKGIIVKLVDFDDAYVRGIMEIFNETPVRQGYKFAHYGKSFETIKYELSKNLHKKFFLGAYLEDELVGFSILYNAEIFAVTNHFLCKISHRDKATANGLMAKVIEACADKGIPYLVYGQWHERSLGDFARNNGFIKIDLPKYHLPLTLKGKAALRLGIHQGLTPIIPKQLKLFLLELRRLWFSMPWYKNRSSIEHNSYTGNST
jgi:hypothetical protein